MVSDPKTRSGALRKLFGAEGGPILEAWAPYRLSPLGAHTDHQGGLTSGITLSQTRVASRSTTARTTSSMTNPKPRPCFAMR